MTSVVTQRLATAEDADTAEVKQHAIDGLEDQIVVVFSLTMPTVVQLGLQACANPLPTACAVAVCDTWQPNGLAYGTPLLVVEALYAVRLWRQVRALTGHGGCICGDTGWMDVRLDSERLARRLKYLVFKYAAHAPHWQFVLWARQLVLMLISVSIVGPMTHAWTGSSMAYKWYSALP